MSSAGELQPGWGRRDVEAMGAALEATRRDLERVRDSRAWRIGHAVTGGLRRMTLRGHSTEGAVQAAIDRIEEVQRSVSASATPPSPPTPAIPEWDAWLASAFGGDPPRAYLTDMAQDHRIWLSTTGLGRELIADPETLQFEKCSFDIEGDDATIALAPGASLHRCRIIVRGHRARVAIGAGVEIRETTLRIDADDGTILVGNASNCFGGALLVHEDGLSVVVGEDCMLSRDIFVRTSDSHSVVDMLSGDRINPPASVVLGDHVWVGAEARIQKGVTVGEHAVIGANTVVTHDVPPHTVVAGNPARVVREDVTWRRSL
ncbi:acyltransferase [Capillimicrobium parvum]|uniref:2,3,4,5-tetrahydropyridine-2,6-dicarboxylate N-acetyltransferase n=1 Tax=Capillimicrobium parvum TaxID=2884022 RepID=A0A9E6Y2S8_9ACTN|nr:acyltransferase [Capillimicrobium parvum]UGS38816.1 2,3,4,5-tetrahydropyridine-2,6-dicarboxylate N-acetyltransferase [Capillimicrobium parvum]